MTNGNNGDRWARMELANDRWSSFMDTRPGLWIKEHTAFVRRISDPEGSPAGALASAVGVPVLVVVVLALLLRSRMLLVAAVVLAVVSTVAVALFWEAYRDSEQRDMDFFDTNPHLLLRNGVQQRLSDRALSREADSALAQTRQDMDQEPSTRGRPIPPSMMGVMLGYSHGIPVWLGCNQPVYVLGATRSGKTSRILIPFIMEWNGPVVATSSRKDIIERTLSARRDGFSIPGRTDYGGSRPRHHASDVWIFDPAGVMADDHRYDCYAINWNPVEECTDPAKARSTAAALVGSADLGPDNRIWQRIGVDITAALLMAAAIDGKGLDTVWEWSQDSTGMNKARTILQNQTDPDIVKFALPIERLQEDDRRTMSNKFLTISGSFSALSDPKTRAWFKPRPSFFKKFDMHAFLTSAATVYMLGRLQPVGGAADANTSVFANLFLDQVRDEARRIAASSVHGRLEPAVMLALDEAANLAPWEGLPQVFTAGTGDGIWPIVVIHSRQQAQGAWGDGEKQMWDNSVKSLMPGQSTIETLREISEMTGTYKQEHIEESWQGWPLPKPGFGFSNIGQMTRKEDKATLKPDEIRRIPVDRALVIAGSSKAAAVRLVPWWRRGWVIDGERGTLE